MGKCECSIVQVDYQTKKTIQHNYILKYGSNNLIIFILYILGVVGHHRDYCSNSIG